MPYSGYTNNTSGSLNKQGPSGEANWWSSSWYSATNAYRLYFTASDVNPSNNANKHNGLSVRF